MTILPDTTGTFFFYSFRLFPERLSVPVPQVMKALVAEGIDGFIGYPGPIPLYKYPVIKDHKTFGSSGWPFTLTGVSRNWNFATRYVLSRRRPVARPFACGGQSFTAEHTTKIGEAIRKVLAAYKR